jgi:hypothetical protein
MQNEKNTYILVTKWKLFKQREKPLQDNQTEEIHSSEVIAIYKTVVLTNPIAVFIP